MTTPLRGLGSGCLPARVRSWRNAGHDVASRRPLPSPCVACPPLAFPHPFLHPRPHRASDGRPLPGTECTSLALIDTQGPPRSLRLGSGDGEDAATPGAHKLFSLATLASSTVALNVMTPLLNQLGQLAPMLRDASTSLLESPRAFAGEPANLVVLERDVLRAAASTDVLEYAWLEPRGDALDAARATLRRLYNNRTLVQMAPPDAADLDALGRGEMPSQHRLRNLPLSGPRPFYAHFEAAAAAVVGALIPKSLGGQPLHGRELAEALSALSTELSEGRPASLAAAVHGSLRAQAQEAATAGVRAGVLALRRLLPSADALADGPTTRDAVESLDDAAGAAAGAAPLRVPSVALVSASSLELALRNATNTALAEFARLAPRYGSSARGEPAPWLEPYVTSVLSELGALERGARHAHAHAQRVLVLHRRERRLLESARDAEASFEAKVEARVAERVQQALAGMGLGADRLADRIDAGADRPPSLDDAGREAATAASGYVAHDGDGRYDASSAVPLPSPQMRQELVSHLLLLAVGTSAAVCPPAALVKLAPLMASAPTFFALMGIYRLAQRPIVRASDYLVRSVRAVGAAISGAATQLAEHAAESGFGQQLVCGHGLRAAPC